MSFYSTMNTPLLGFGYTLNLPEEIFTLDKTDGSKLIRIIGISEIQYQAPKPADPISQPLSCIQQVAP